MSEPGSLGMGELNDEVDSCFVSGDVFIGSGISIFSKSSTKVLKVISFGLVVLLSRLSFLFSTSASVLKS